MASLFDTETPTGSAVISECGTYRYRLERSWDTGKPCGVFVMLNPSVANADLDDPTIRRCVGFARAWGWGRLVVVNLFAYRATDPKELKAAVDPVGPENDRHIREAVADRPVVCAWGGGGGFVGRDRAVLRLLREAGVEPMCLRLSGGGHPWHPLYARSDWQLQPFGRGAAHV